jgi:hypothetical protein
MASWYYQSDPEWCAHLAHGHGNNPWKRVYLQTSDDGWTVKCFLCKEFGSNAQNNDHWRSNTHQSRLRTAFGIAASEIWAPPRAPPGQEEIPPPPPGAPPQQQEPLPRPTMQSAAPPPAGAPPRQQEPAPPTPAQSAAPPGVAPVSLTVADRLFMIQQEVDSMIERHRLKLEEEMQLVIERQMAKPRASNDSASSASDADWIRPQSEHKDLLERVSEMEVKIEALDQALVRTQGLASRAAEMEVKLEALELKILQLENDPSATEEANVVLVEKPGHDFHQGLVPSEPCFAFR